jgi:agmatine deiminase
MAIAMSDNAARQPPEWAGHQWAWIGFPSHEALWEDDLAGARVQVTAFARAVHAEGEGEEVRLVAADSASARAAAEMAPFATVVTEGFGDIWLRDTGPIILGSGAERRAASFGFNGWGGKYELEGDQDIGLRLARDAGFDAARHDWILEGGAIDVDGTGLAVTTEQCLLNPNRNPGVDRGEIERRLADDLGIERLLWLGEGLANDHTDGHVDNLARFVAPGRLAIPVPAGDDDPNREIYRDARARAEAFGLEVVPLPSPGLVVRHAETIPASYMNFYIGNRAVVVPIHGAANDGEAVRLVGALFPDRAAIGIRTDHLLTGGGSFHCISQQMPL